MAAGSLGFTPIKPSSSSGIFGILRSNGVSMFVSDTSNSIISNETLRTTDFRPAAMRDNSRRSGVFFQLNRLRCAWYT